jgi:hypothetical protein
VGKFKSRRVSHRCATYSNEKIPKIVISGRMSRRASYNCWQWQLIALRTVVLTGENDAHDGGRRKRKVGKNQGTGKWRGGGHKKKAGGLGARTIFDRMEGIIGATINEPVLAV